MAEIYLAGGCFWGTEKYIASINGVQSTQVGYANGNTENPTYQEVCKGNTGHAEAVHVIYDSEILALDFLLELYFNSINPLSINRQGGDFGVQYRTGIYYISENDRLVIERSIAGLQKRFDKPVAIEVLPLSNFYSAEEYHQKYLDKNPGGYCHIGKDKFEQAAKALVNPSGYPAINSELLHKKLTPLQYEVTGHGIINWTRS